MATTHEERLRKLADERRGWAAASTPTVRPRHESDAAACLAGAEALRLLREYQTAWEAAPPGLRTIDATTPELREALRALLATEVTR